MHSALGATFKAKFERCPNLMTTAQHQADLLLATSFTRVYYHYVIRGFVNVITLELVSFYQVGSYTSNICHHNVLRST